MCGNVDFGGQCFKFLFVDSQDLWMIVVWLLVVNVVGNPPRIYRLQNILTCRMHQFKHLDGNVFFGPFWIYVVVFYDFFIDSCI
jgi:hypothetical protein